MHKNAKQYLYILPLKFKKKTEKKQDSMYHSSDLQVNLFDASEARWI